MRTANTIHAVACSTCGALALVTVPALGRVKGYCGEHLDDIHKTINSGNLTADEIAVILSLVKQRKAVTTNGLH